MGQYRVLASNEQEADAYIGAPVKFDFDHPDNSDDDMISLLGPDAVGHIIHSTMWQRNSRAPFAHVVAVAFTTDKFSGVIGASGEVVSGKRFFIQAQA
jgi:hypothetical protein